MRWMLIGVLMLAGCGGSGATQPAAFGGRWAVQFDGASVGEMTLAPAGPDGISGTWDFGSRGQGNVAGSIGFDGSIGLVFALADRSIPFDATATVAAGSMTGVVGVASDPTTHPVFRAALH